MHKEGNSFRVYETIKYELTKWIKISKSQKQLKL